LIQPVVLRHEPEEERTFDEALCALSKANELSETKFRAAQRLRRSLCSFTFDP